MGELVQAIQTGSEHGVGWIIDNTQYRDIILVSVIGEKGNESKIYKCRFKHTLGYSKYDITAVEVMLDELIAKYATDGYAGMNRVKLPQEADEQAHDLKSE